VDGVLNAGWEEGLSPSRVRVLDAFLRETPHVEVILNSAWNIHPIEETQEKLYAAGLSHANRLVGTTQGSGGGGKPILQWCRDNGAEEAQIAILDDNAHNMGGLWSRLTWVSPQDILSEAHMDHLAGTFLTRSVEGNIQRMIRNRDVYLASRLRTWLTEAQLEDLRREVLAETQPHESTQDKNWLAYLLGTEE
jgi:hypothetical protein